MYCNENNVRFQCTLVHAKPLLKIGVLLLVKCEAKFKHWAMCFHQILQVAKSSLPSCEDPQSLISTISPKHGYIGFVTQVNILILITYNEDHYHPEDCLLGLHFWDLFFDQGPAQILLDCEFNPATTTVALRSSFQDIQTGQLTLRGLCHQKIYIMKFMARYVSVMISRWVTGKCSMTSAMHYIMIYEVWIKT